MLVLRSLKRAMFRERCGRPGDFTIFSSLSQDTSRHRLGDAARQRERCTASDRRRGRRAGRCVASPRRARQGTVRRARTCRVREPRCRPERAGAASSGRPPARRRSGSTRSRSVRRASLRSARFATPMKSIAAPGYAPSGSVAIATGSGRRGPAASAAKQPDADERRRPSGGRTPTRRPAYGDQRRGRVEGSSRGLTRPPRAARRERGERRSERRRRRRPPDDADPAGLPPAAGKSHETGRREQTRGRGRARHGRVRRQARPLRSRTERARRRVRPRAPPQRCPARAMRSRRACLREGLRRERREDGRNDQRLQFEQTCPAGPAPRRRVRADAPQDAARRPDARARRARRTRANRARSRAGTALPGRCARPHPHPAASTTAA